MCIIFYALNKRGYSLILAANRDEFLIRPTTAATWHDFITASSTSEPSPDCRYLSGLDLTGGGTWLGLAIPPRSNGIKLRFATLTNYTEVLSPTVPPRPSRGELVRNFLETEGPTEALVEYLKMIEERKRDYAGFNLLVGELGATGQFKMGYTSNRSEDHGRIVTEESVGLSNSTLEEPWPKVVEGNTALAEAYMQCREGAVDEDAEKDALVGRLWNVLSTSWTQPVRDRTQLRHTILVKPLQVNLATSIPAQRPSFPPPSPAPTISTPSSKANWYGTRVQTVILIQDGRVTFRERDAFVLNELGEAVWSGVERKFDLNLE